MLLLAVEFGELVVDAGQDGGQAFGFAGPAVVLGFLRLGEDAVAGAFEAGAGAGVGAGEFALLAGVFVGAAGAVGARAVADRDLALGEVVLGFVPFGGGDGPVFGGWPLLAAVLGERGGSG